MNKEGSSAPATHISYTRAIKRDPNLPKKKRKSRIHGLDDTVVCCNPISSIAKGPQGEKIPIHGVQSLLWCQMGYQRFRNLIDGMGITRSWSCTCVTMNVPNRSSSMKKKRINLMPSSRVPPHRILADRNHRSLRPETLT